MVVGEKIAFLRGKLGFSLADVARNISRTVDSIKAIERCEVTPSPITIGRMAVMFGVTEQYLVGDIVKPEESLKEFYTRFKILDTLTENDKLLILSMAERLAWRERKNERV